MTTLKAGKPNHDKRLSSISNELKHGKKKVKFNMNLDRKKHQQFKAKCAMNGVEMTEVLMATIDEYISK